MDGAAVEKTARAWLDALASSSEELAPLKSAQLTAYPAFLKPSETQDGDDHLAGAVPIKIEEQEATEDLTERVRSALRGDPTLGGRAKNAHFEAPTKAGEVGTLVIIPL